MYRYTLGSDVSMSDVHDTLLLAVLAIECMYGSAQARLELFHELDPKKRVCVIDASTPVGRDLNQLFTGFLQKEFGADSFRVERVPHGNPLTIPHGGDHG
tara:strand:+ start:191 stop:490 length:300 start_codon:yes stop_codon:yes gene_type:complete